MVSFWPWKANDSSPASFEKALASLSEKIQKTTTRLDNIRQQSRRLSVLWMLYAGFAYLICSIILVLVIGWRNWGLAEYSAIAGSPIFIYLVRLGLTTLYDYRTSAIQAQVDDLQKQRDVTIKKLKTATKFDSTQELLKKYGGTPTPKPKPAGGSDNKADAQQSGRSTQRGQRTGFSPPPTANIPGTQKSLPAHGISQSPMHTKAQQPASPFEQHSSPLQQSPTAEFAPNAFPTLPQYAPVREGRHWYDRLVDVLLGEDESLPSKRLALICNRCRLVNGQAPPGVKRLEDVGQWRCGSCGSINGEEDDMKKIAKKLKGKDAADPMPVRKEASDDGKLASPSAVEDEESDVTIYTEDEDDAQAAYEEPSVPKKGPEVTTRRTTQSHKEREPLKERG